jgi:hypothetical protein
MHVDYASYSWFIFNLNTEISLYLQITYYNNYTTYNASLNPSPCFITSCIYLLGEPASLLVVMNTHPPLSLVCQQLHHPLLALPPFHTPQFKLHYLHRWLSNLSRLRPEQCLCLLITWPCLLYHMPVSPNNMPCPLIMNVSPCNMTFVSLQHACISLPWICLHITCLCLFTITSQHVCVSVDMPLPPYNRLCLLSTCCVSFQHSRVFWQHNSGPCNMNMPPHDVPVPSVPSYIMLVSAGSCWPLVFLPLLALLPKFLLNGLTGWFPSPLFSF